MDDALKAFGALISFGLIAWEDIVLHKLPLHRRFPEDCDNNWLWQQIAIPITGLVLMTAALLIVL